LTSVSTCLEWLMTRTTISFSFGPTQRVAGNLSPRTGHRSPPYVDRV
jgi:hypothetical protein